MRESLKRTSQWSAYYFTHRRSYYPLPENSISLRDIPKMSPMPPKEISQADQTPMQEWAQEDGKAMRQRTVRQCTTKHNAGTLSLNVLEKELPLGRESSASQDSEYDSGSDEEERESAEDEGEDSLDLNAINFSSRSVRTRSGRVISLSHQALASY